MKTKENFNLFLIDLFNQTIDKLLAEYGLNNNELNSIYGWLPCFKCEGEGGSYGDEGFKVCEKCEGEEGRFITERSLLDYLKINTDDVGKAFVSILEDSFKTDNFEELLDKDLKEFLSK